MPLIGQNECKHVCGNWSEIKTDLKGFKRGNT